MKIPTKEFYKSLSSKELSGQEILETKNNFVGFFDLLYRIDKRNEEKKESEISNNNLTT